MSMVCPKTHYDLLKMRMPRMVGMIEKQFFGNEEAPHEIDFGDRYMEMAAEIGRRQGIGVNQAFNLMGLIPRHLPGDRPEMDGFVDLMMSLVIEIEAMKEFNRHRRKVFYFSDNLTDKLMDTEVSLDVDFLRLPFPSVMFAYDAKRVREALPGHANGSGAVSVFLRPDELGDTGIPTILMTVGYNVPRRNLSSFEHVIPLAPGTSVEDAILAKKVKSKVEQGDKITRLVANSILYLASSNPDIANGIRNIREIKGDYTNKQKRFLAETATSMDYLYVGGRSERYQRDPADAEPSSTRPLSYRVKVMGHWKSQAYGPKWSQHRPIHIEPYWKGDDFAEAIEKAYRVN